MKTTKRLTLELIKAICDKNDYCLMEVLNGKKRKIKNKLT